MAGRGVISGRDNDTFGIGYYYSVASDKLPSVLDIDDGQGLELFYNFEVTPWLHITPDVQSIDSSFDAADNAWVLGLRTRMDF